MNTTRSNGSEHYIDDEIDLVDYIRVLIKRKYFILIFTLCFAIIGIFLWREDKVYEAKTLILLSLKVEERSASQELTLGSPNTQIVIPTLSAQTYEVLATTDDMHRNLRDSLTVFWKDSTNTKTSYALNAELMQPPGSSPSQLLTLRVTSTDPNVPVSVANIWTRLFVERNRGLSSGVAKDYYDWASDQYHVAQKNLTEKETALQSLQAKYHSLNMVQNEVNVKNTELDASLGSYHSQEVALASKLRELKYVQKSTSILEINGEWIGFLPIEQLPTPGQVLKEPDSMAKTLTLLMHELAKLEQDSIAILRKFEEEQLVFQLQEDQAYLQFENDKQIEAMRKKAGSLRATLDAYRTELPDLQQKNRYTDTEIDVYRQNLEKEKPIFVLSKAITDEALWSQIAHNGRVSESKQTDLSRYKLQSEHINPVYQQLVGQTVNLQIQKDLYQQRIAFLKLEIPALQQELIQVQRHLDSLKFEEKRLGEDLYDKRLTFGKQMDKDKMSVLSKLQRRRRLFEDSRGFYLENKQRAQSLANEIEHIQKDIEFQRSRFENWRDEIEGLSAVVDSLQLQRVQLERSIAVYGATFTRFSKLLEEARISLEQAAGDLQVVSWAAEASPQAAKKTVLIIVVIGGCVSVFFAFVMEYLEKARERLRRENG